MNDGICRFHHRNNDSNECHDDKYRDLEEKYNSLLEDYQNMLRRIEAIEREKQSLRSRSLSDNQRICTRSRSQGDVKRKHSDDVIEMNNIGKKNKIDDDTIVADDNNTVSKMEEDSEEIIVGKQTEVSYSVFFKKFENELQNIKNAVGKERKMTVKSTKRIKEMIRTVGKDYKYCERTENMMKRSQAFIKEYEKTYDKIEKIENSKFRDVTSVEIQKLIKMCKIEQKITS